jgi:predicted DNA-binding protein
MKRTNIYLSDKQHERLGQRAETEGVPVAELVRRAVDAYLAWDDPLYQPSQAPLPQIRKRHSSPP